MYYLKGKIRVIVLMMVISILITVFGMSEVKGYYQKSLSKNTSFTTASYSALTLSLDKTSYPSGNNTSTVLLTVTNPNSYAVSYTLSFSNTNATYTIDGSAGATYVVSGNSNKTNTIVISGATGTSITITVNTILPYSASKTIVASFDNVNPTVEVTTTNNVAASQTATLKCSDNVGVTAYYWGTTEPTSVSNITTTTTADLNSLKSTSGLAKTVSGAGTYWLGCRDAAGNFSKTSIVYRKVTLSMSNGTVSPTSIVAKSGNSVALPTPTANNGYTNAGYWYSSNAYSTSVGAYGANYTVSSTTTIYSRATDVTAPTVSFNPNTSSSYAKTASVTVTVADAGSKVKANQTIKYRWQTGTTCSTTASDYTSSATLSNTSAAAETATATASASGLTGTHYLCVYSGIQDVAGNNSVITKSGSFLFDNTAPSSCTWGNWSTSYIKSGGIATITLTCADANSGITMDLATSDVTVSGTNLGSVTAVTKGGSNTSRTYTFTLTGGSASGTPTLTIAANKVQDVAGNKFATAKTSGSIAVDNTAPTLTVSADTNYTKSKSATITIADSGGSALAAGTYTVRYVWSTSNITTCNATNLPNTVSISVSAGNTSKTGTASVSGGTGAGKIYVCSTTAITDRAGNSLAANTISSANNYLDNTAPTISLVSMDSQSLSTYTKTKSYRIRLSDANSGLAAGTYSIKYAYGTTSSGYTCDSSEMTNTISISATAGAATAESATIDITGTQFSRIYVCNVSAISDRAGNSIAANTTTTLVNMVDNVNPTLSVTVTSGTTYAKSKTATVTISDTFSKFAAGTHTIRYVWSTSNVTTCNSTSMPNTATITTTAGASSATTTVNIASGTGAGKLYICNAAAISDQAGNSLAASTIKSADMYLDNTLPTLSVSVTNGTTYAKNRDATITIGDANSGLAAGTYTIKYAWGTSSVACSSMTLTKDITVAAGATSGTGTVNISSGTGTGSIYICNSAAISDRAGNSLAASTVKSASMYLDNTAPSSCTWGNWSSSYIKSGATATITLTCADANSGITMDLAASDVTVSGTNLGTVTNVTKGGSNSSRTYTFTLTGGSASGTPTLTIAANKVQDVAGNKFATAKTSGSIIVDAAAPTLAVSVSNGTTYAKSKTATVTIADTGGSGLAATAQTIRYVWSTSNVTTCNSTSMPNTISITPTAGSNSATGTITIESGTGAGKLYICNAAAISDRASNSLAASTIKSADMYLDNTAPSSCSWGNWSTSYIKSGGTATITLTCADANSGITMDLATSDVTVSGTNLGTVTAVSKGGSNASRTYTFTLTGGSASGTPTLTIAANKIQDVAGNKFATAKTSGSIIVDVAAPTLAVSVSSGTTYAKSKTATVTIADTGGSGLAATAQTIRYVWSTSNVTTCNATSMPNTISITPTAGSNSATGTITIDSGTGAGKLYICNAAAISDRASNSLAASTIKSADMYLDNTAPSSCSWGSWSSSYIKSGATATITLTCADANSGITMDLATSDVTVSGTNLGTVTNVTKGGSNTSRTYTFTLTGGSASGTPTLTIAANKVQDVAGNKFATAKTSGSIIVDVATPTLAVSVSNGTTYAKSKSATVTIADTGGSGLAATAQTIRYVWSTSNVTTCNSTSMPNTISITPTAGSNSATGTITIDSGTGTGKLYICNSSAISDRASNSLAASTIKSADMYLDNTAPSSCSWGNWSTSYIKSGGTATITLTCADANSGITMDLATSDVTVSGTNLGTVTAVTKGGSNTSRTYTFTLTGGSASGTPTLTIAANKIQDVAGNKFATAKTSGSIIVDVAAPTLAVSVSNGTTYAKSKSATVTIADTGGSGLAATAQTIRYVWSTSNVTTCNSTSMPNTISITPTAGASSTTGTITIDSGTGAGKLYICNSSAISDRVSNSLAASTIKSADMYLDNTAPSSCSWGNWSTSYIKSGGTATITLTCADANSGITMDLATSDVTVSGTNLGTVTAVSKGGSNASRTYTFTLTGGSASGTPTLTIAANKVQDVAGNKFATAKTSGSIIVDVAAPTLAVSVSSGTTYAKSKTATVTIADTGGSGLAATAQTIRYVWSTSNVTTCNSTSMPNTISITPTAGASSATGTITIDSGTGAGKLYICNAAAILDRVSNSLAASQVKSADMYLDNTAPSSCSWGNWSSSYIKSGATATITLTCADANSGITMDLATSDVTVSGTNLGTVTNVTKGGSNTSRTYTFTLTGGSASGTPTLTIAANKVQDVAGNKFATAKTSGSIIVDVAAPTLAVSVSSGTTYAKSKTATVTIADTGGSGLAATAQTIRYVWSTSNVTTCNSTSMPNTISITPTAGASSATGTITIDSGTGTGKLYICNSSAISDRASNSLAASQVKSADMYLDNTAPSSCSWGNWSTSYIKSGGTATITLTCADANSGITMDLATSDVTVSGTNLGSVTAVSKGGSNASRTYTFTLTGGSASGTPTLTIAANKVQDVAGNKFATAKTSGSIIVDVAAPTLAVSVSNGTTYAKSKTATVTIADTGGSGLAATAQTIRYVWSTSNVTACNSTSMPNTISITPTAGSNSATGTITISSGTGAGKLYICNSAAISDRVSNSLAANTIKSADMYLDNTAPSSCSWGNWSTSYIKSGGTATITLTCADANSGITMDLATSDVTVSGTNLGSVTAVSKGGSNTSRTYTFTLTGGSASGTPTLTIAANKIQDVVGNKFATAKTSGSIIVDVAAPTLAVSVSNGTTYAKSKSATVTISDTGGSGLAATAQTIRYVWSTSSVTACNSTSMPNTISITPTAGASSATGTITIDSGTGAGSIYICNAAAISDRASNSLAASQVKSASMYLDNTGPSCTWGSWEDSNIDFGASTTITLTCSDTNSSVSTTSLTSSNFTLSNSSAYSITATLSSNGNEKVFIITALASASGGSGTVTLKAGQVVDSLSNGNAAVTSPSLTANPDEEGPTITFGTDGNSTYAKSQSTIVTVTDPSGVASSKYLWTQTNGASASNGTSFTSGANISKNTGDGIWYLCIYATDNAGNSSNKCSNAFNLDNTAPTITANNLCLLKGSAATATSYATATDANQATLTASPASINTSSTGSSTVTYTATDSAGNTSTKSITVTVYTKVSDLALVSTGDGLYTDTAVSGRYLFKGSDPNNYVSYGGKTWRIIAIEADGSYKLIYSGFSETGVTFHTSSSGLTTSNFTSMRIYTGSLTTFYNSLTDTSAINTSYPFKTGMVGSVDSGVKISGLLSIEDNATTNLKIGLPNISDYARASTSSSCQDSTAYSSVSNCKTNNWLFNSSHGSWIINIYSSTRARYWRTTGAVAYNYPTTTSENSKDLGVKPVIYLKNNTTFTGSGASTDPFVVNTSCQSTAGGISSTTCTVTAPSGYDTSKVLTITPSSSTGVTYSWDNVTYNSANTTTISAAGTYGAFIRDADGRMNTCSITIKSRTEYQHSTCSSINSCTYCSDSGYIRSNSYCYGTILTGFYDAAECEEAWHYWVSGNCYLNRKAAVTGQNVWHCGCRTWDTSDTAWYTDSCGTSNYSSCKNRNTRTTYSP